MSRCFSGSTIGVDQAGMMQDRADMICPSAGEPDQNKREPGGLPDIREPVEFPDDSDDQPAQAVMTRILSGTSVPSVSFRSVYV